MGTGYSQLDDCVWDGSFTSGPWTIKNGTLSNSVQISLFTPTKAKKQNQSLLRSLTKQLKIIRHPSILHFVAAEDGDIGTFVMTERVSPLSEVLQSLSSLEICAGLHSILEALTFIHDKVGVCHNNVCLGSIYVCPDGSWRLGGLEHACKFSKASQAYLSSCKELRDVDSISPEEKLGQVNAEAVPSCARDVYSFAVMTESLLQRMEDLGDLTKTFELRIQDECLNDDPRQRPKAQSLLEDRLFKSEFLQTDSFLRSIAMKTNEERQEFFKTLLPKLFKLPERVIGRRLVPLLMARFVLLDQSALENVVPSLLTPNAAGLKRSLSTQMSGVTPLLSESVYAEFVVPQLVKIISVRDHHIHRLMLEYFPLYVHLVDKEILELDVFPQVLLGLRDSSDDIAALSLHALGEMVPILGRDVVVGGQSKTFFKEGLPKAASSLPGEMLNNRMSNIHGVMEKVLLKDLSNKKSSPPKDSRMDAVKEKKMKEREMRREEMKKRREERKQARAKAEKQSTSSSAISDKDGVQSIETDNTPIEDKEITTPGDESFNSELDNQTISGAQNNSIVDEIRETDKKSFLISDSDSDRENDTKPKVTILYTDDENDDWGDIYGEKEYSVISDGIEEELRSMSVTQNQTTPTSQQSEISTNPTHSTSKSMKLTSNKKTDKNNPQKVDIPDDLNLSFEKELLTSNKPLTLNKSHNKTKTKAMPKLQSDGFTGAFDIKSLDIKLEKTEDPFDFFADMAPSIKLPAKVESKTEELSSFTPSTDESSAAATTAAAKLSFDVVESVTENGDDGTGWEEEDW